MKLSIEACVAFERDINLFVDHELPVDQGSQLVEVDHMAYRDAADVLGCKLENFKMIVCRARKKIFASLVRVLGSQHR